MSDEPLSITTTLTRGTSTDDRDQIKATVEAENFEDLQQKLAQLRQQLDDWADDLREIQPTNEGRPVADDQAALGEVDA